MRILIADDDPTLRSELAELLRGDGHEVRVAADGREALRLLESEACDVALLDLVMPGSTGLEILKRLQGARSGTAVVMVTGHGSVDVAVEAMKAGAVDFIVKPFEVPALQRVLQSIADERRARAMLARPAAGADGREGLLADAASRNALLAVLGPEVPPPRGATRVLRLDSEGRPPDVFAPSQLYRLNAAIETFVTSKDRPVVYASGLESIQRLHGRDDLKAWIRHVASRCAVKDGILVVVPPDSALAADLEMETDAVASEPELQSMLESLANPIRRAIVSYVFTAGPAAYSGILRMDFVDSSSKLSFHLQKLQADGLMTKTENGAYALTEEGRRAWRVVRALSEERRRPAIVFAPA